MSKFKYYINAMKASEKSDFYKCHTGCVAVYSGHIIAEGYNSIKTHTLQTKYNKYRDFDPNVYRGCIHAEMMVIQKIKYLDIDFNKVELYISRGTKDKPLLSKPCKACERAIRDLGISKVNYTGYNSYVSEKYT